MDTKSLATQTLHKNNINQSVIDTDTTITDATYTICTIEGEVVELDVEGLYLFTKTLTTALNIGDDE